MSYCRSKYSLISRNNTILKLTEEARLRELEQEIVGNQLKNLYTAIERLSHKKFLEDRLNFEIADLKTKMEEAVKTREWAMMQSANLGQERDKLRGDVRDMARSRLNLIREKEIYAKATKDKISALEVDLHKLKTQLNNKSEAYEVLQKSFKIMSNERDKLKDRLQKLKNKRHRVDINQKLCKKCGKEYLETENYNWSCRTHKTEYRVMWWCCGKRNKDAPGCTVSKHESRDDEEDADMEENEGKNKNLRCYCCKEKGHEIKECPQDPNFKSGEDPKTELVRVLKSGNSNAKQEKSDGLIHATNLIKDLIKDRDHDTPFSYGCLKFDDYNYDFINPMVLISHQKMLKIHYEKEKVKNKSDDITLDKDLLTKVNEKYGEANFTDLELLNSNAKAGILSPTHTLNESNFKTQNETLSPSESKEGEGSQGLLEEEEEEESDEENFSTRGFDFEHIEEIRQVQDSDPFQDVIQLKQQVEIEADDSGQNSKRGLLRDIYEDENEILEEIKKQEMSESESLSHSSSKLFNKQDTYKMGVSTMMEDIKGHESRLEKSGTYSIPDNNEIEIRRRRKNKLF